MNEEDLIQAFLSKDPNEVQELAIWIFIQRAGLAEGIAHAKP